MVASTSKDAQSCILIAIVIGTLLYVEVPRVNTQTLIESGVLDEVGGLNRFFGCGCEHHLVQFLLADEHPLVVLFFYRAHVGVHHIEGIVSARVSIVCTVTVAQHVISVLRIL